ncbi:MAG: hypothetical protein U0V87_12780 [Acidobacteriota bacterium]
MWNTAHRFGSYLRELREERRLTLDDIERITADAPEPITRSLLSRLENGRARVSALKLLALASSYRVRLSVLAERLEMFHAHGELASSSQSAAQACVEADAALASGNVDRARALFGLVDSSVHADRRVVDELRLEIARKLLDHSRPRAARGLIEGALSMTPDDPSALPLLLLLVQVAQALGQPLLVRSATLALRQQPRPWHAKYLCDVAALEAHEQIEAGRTDAAIDIWLRTLDLTLQSGEHRNAARATMELARLERARRRHQAALSWLEKARHHAELGTDAALWIRIALEAGDVQIERQRSILARRAWGEAREKARESQRPDLSFAALLRLWRLARAQSDAADERAMLRTLRSLARSLEELPLDATDLLPHLMRDQTASARRSVNG